MINGVLVERTVSDVLPSLKTNSDGLKQVLEELLKQYKSKQSELDTWKVCSPVLLRMLHRIFGDKTADFFAQQKKNKIQVVQP